MPLTNIVDALAVPGSFATYIPRVARRINNNMPYERIASDITHAGISLLTEAYKLYSLILASGYIKQKTGDESSDILFLLAYIASVGYRLNRERQVGIPNLNSL